MIPRAALALGLGGLIPFVYAAVALSEPTLRIDALPPRSVLEVYGVVILCFMAGCLWGFAAKDGARLWLWLGLSVIPAIAIFFSVLWFGDNLIALLLTAFPALLILDAAFARAALAPPWWMRLRLLLTAVVSTCLAIGALS